MTWNKFFNNQVSQYTLDTVCAFSHECQNVNISVFDKTFTFYPKKDNKTITNVIHLDPMMYSLFRRVRKELDMIFPGSSSIQLNDMEHSAFHHDDFSKYHYHYHIQFTFEINAEKFCQMLGLFVKLELMSAEEYDQVVSAYGMANRLPKHFVDKIIALSWLDTFNTIFFSFPINPALKQHIAIVVEDFKKIIELGHDLELAKKYIKITKRALDNPTLEHVMVLLDIDSKFMRWQQCLARSHQTQLFHDLKHLGALLEDELRVQFSVRYKP